MAMIGTAAPAQNVRLRQYRLQLCDPSSQIQRITVIHFFAQFGMAFVGRVGPYTRIRDTYGASTSRACSK
jgi:hypothetical protein